MIGTFVPGQNAPRSVEAMKTTYKQADSHVQILLELEHLFGKEDKLNIWFQYLLDSTMQVSDRFHENSLKTSLGKPFSYLQHLSSEG